MRMAATEETYESNGIDVLIDDAIRSGSNAFVRDLMGGK